MARVQRKEVKREAISIRLTTEAKNEVLFEMKCHNFTSYSAYFEHLREVHNASPIDAAAYEKTRLNAERAEIWINTVGKELEYVLIQLQSCFQRRQ